MAKKKPHEPARQKLPGVKALTGTQSFPDEAGVYYLAYEAGAGERQIFFRAEDTPAAIEAATAALRAAHPKLKITSAAWADLSGTERLLFESAFRNVERTEGKCYSQNAAMICGLADEFRIFLDAIEAGALDGLDDADSVEPPQAQVNTLLKSEPAEFPSPFQQSILDALDGKALKKEALAEAIKLTDSSRLYKKNGIAELRTAGLVSHKTALGYYRPDRPPERH